MLRYTYIACLHLKCLFGRPFFRPLDSAARSGRTLHAPHPWDDDHAGQSLWTHDSRRKRFGEPWETLRGHNFRLTRCLLRQRCRVRDWLRNATSAAIELFLIRAKDEKCASVCSGVRLLIYISVQWMRYIRCCSEFWL